MMSWEIKILRLQPNLPEANIVSMFLYLNEVAVIEIGWTRTRDYTHAIELIDL